MPRPVIHRQTGFTLMEVMVVIAIIAVMAAISLPVFRHLSRAEVSEADQQFARIISEIRSYRGTHIITNAKILEHLQTYKCLANDIADCAAENDLSKMIPTLALSQEALFHYAVAADEDTDGEIQYCIIATSTSDENKTVLFSSRRTDVATWENHSSMVKYYDPNKEHEAGGHCAADGTFSATCTGCIN